MNLWVSRDPKKAYSVFLETSLGRGQKTKTCQRQMLRTTLLPGSLLLPRSEHFRSKRRGNFWGSLRGLGFSFQVVLGRGVAASHNLMEVNQEPAQNAKCSDRGGCLRSPCRKWNPGPGALKERALPLSYTPTRCLLGSSESWPGYAHREKGGGHSWD